MNCTGIDPPRRASLEIASNMSVAGEQIVGLERHEATKLLIRVAMGYSQATSSHGHQTAAFQACAALECDRLGRPSWSQSQFPKTKKQGIDEHSRTTSAVVRSPQWIRISAPFPISMATANLVR